MQQYLSHRQSRSGLSHWEQTTVFVGLISQNISDPAANLKPDFLACALPPSKYLGGLFRPHAFATPGSGKIALCAHQYG
jgi:hypothetical protein